MSPVLCRLTTAMPAGAGRAPVTRAHLRSCLRCQASAARGRVLRRELAGLGSEVTPAPPYLAATVMARLGEQGAAHPGHRVVAGLTGRYAAAAGVGAAAAAAVITGMIRRRSRIA